jgi:hypothetical protein
MLWDTPTASQCSTVYDATTSTSAEICDAPATLVNGTRYMFLACFDQRDSRIHLYQNGTEFAHSTDALTSTLYPRLDDATSSFRTDANGNGLGLKIHRVLACSTADPASCR